jgi:hypothetical protein
MSYSTIVELTVLAAAEQRTERKMALLEELRKLLNAEKEMLQANLRNFFPRVALSDQSQADCSNEEANTHRLREHAKDLKMKAFDLLWQADALVTRAERVDRASQANGPAKPEKAFGQAA